MRTYWHPVSEPPPACIGVFDSGLGGLSVLREIHRLLPGHRTLYVADQAHLPYGPRPLAEIRRYVFAVSQFMLGSGARAVVLACHAASAGGLHALRQAYPHTPFVGIEPAVKPAAERTRTGAIGVLTTRATARGALYRSVVRRYAGGVRVVTQVAPELVLLVEQGAFAAPEPHSDARSKPPPAARHALERAVEPLLAANVDHIVLACTHFPFLLPALRQIVPAHITFVDPAPAVARQTARVLGLSPDPAASPDDTAPADIPSLAGEPGHRYLTSGDPLVFARQVYALTGARGSVERLAWSHDETAVY
jgi:glutamate racemase